MSLRTPYKAGDTAISGAPSNVTVSRSFDLVHNIKIKADPVFEHHGTKSYGASGGRALNTSKLDKGEWMIRFTSRPL
jgi:hypothetical protein